MPEKSTPQKVTAAQQRFYDLCKRRWHKVGAVEVGPDGAACFPVWAGDTVCPSMYVTVRANGWVG